MANHLAAALSNTPGHPDRRRRLRPLEAQVDHRVVGPSASGRHHAATVSSAAHGQTPVQRGPSNRGHLRHVILRQAFLASGLAVVAGQHVVGASAEQPRCPREVLQLLQDARLPLARRVHQMMPVFLQHKRTRGVEVHVAC
eukprot:scaffold9113_cov61-Phaeocystis_antarctica.AAC.3